VPQELLRSYRVAPKIRPAGLLLKLRKLGALRIGVKDTSEARLPAPPVQCTWL